MTQNHRQQDEDEYLHQNNRGCTVRRRVQKASFLSLSRWQTCPVQAPRLILHWTISALLTQLAYLTTITTPPVRVCVSVFVYLSIGKWENMNERKIRAGQRYISLHVVFICEVRWTSEQSRIHETCMRLGNCPYGSFLPLGTINSSESLSIVNYLKYECFLHLCNDHTLHFDNTANHLVFLFFVFWLGFFLWIRSTDTQ